MKNITMVYMLLLFILSMSNYVGFPSLFFEPFKVWNMESVDMPYYGRDKQYFFHYTDCLTEFSNLTVWQTDSASSYVRSPKILFNIGILLCMARITGFKAFVK